MIENAIKAKLRFLTQRAALASGEAGDLIGENVGSWEGWLTEALHVVELIFPNPNSIYRARVEEFADDDSTHSTYKVKHIGAILRGLSRDIEDGLIANLANKIRAEAFDDFLDHAEVYHVAGRKNEAGVIAGVVFEDTIRRVFREKVAQPDAGKSLEDIINTLAKFQTLSSQQSKQAKVAAHVRTKATHAQWDEFDMSGVEATIHLTRRLLGDHLGA